MALAVMLKMGALRYTHALFLVLKGLETTGKGAALNMRLSDKGLFLYGSLLPQDSVVFG